MKPTLYLPMLLMFTATAAGAEDKPATPQKQQAAKSAEKSAKPADDVDRDALEKEFAKKLTGSTLVGFFTTDGQDAKKPPESDRYELISVTKGEGDFWFFAHKYGSHDFKVPIPLKVLWAGDTPMISLTELSFPGLGTFTCRIMFYGDRYAGTWQHGEVGGHMWGKIERTKAAASPAPKKEEAKAKTSDKTEKQPN